ncbi:flagellar motor switch phosphatase FliY [Clostridium swellfunianum]|uniref:flagellar motor switch phosphatase FliY n=1 Tax=Clostridium swellfunianum TaxID=1367462 RepID=UPI00202FC2B1|nr:flagellar motor switch phosphatase FliY [Clostridium swellfunianum]MCM0650469.1 flagellar motor switch phosphatase FliY [Clostridium swellfunianum]
MSSGFLSQEEIDSLLNGGSLSTEPPQEELLSDIEKDLLGEIGNISMGSASTALSQIIGQQVNITTPVVSVTTLNKLKENFEVPNIALEVMYTSGITGENLLVMKITDAAIIANLMMGGDGKIEMNELSEIEESAVSEAMNQMIGSAATSMATMFAREVNISPPHSKVWRDSTNNFTEAIDEDENIIQVSFKITIGELVDSTIMQLLPMETAKKIVSIMMGTESNDTAKPQIEEKPIQTTYEAPAHTYKEPEQARRSEPAVEINRAAFQPLRESSVSSAPKNIDLILDVPLEISVVLGRTKKSIKDILNLGTGSLIELDKLAEEPVEILVNGKIVAFGEVVVVDENFGVRISSIVSGAERVKSLSK